MTHDETPTSPFPTSRAAPRDRFVAEGLAERPPVDDLLALLDQHEVARAALPVTRSDDQLRLEARQRFALDWGAFADHKLRGALEEVVWQLEQRGHHAWIEEHGTRTAPELTGPMGPVVEVPSPIAMRLLEADAAAELAAAAELRFDPDLTTALVTPRAWYGDPRHTSPVALAPAMSLDVLDEKRVIAFATQFVGHVLAAGHRS